MIKQLTVGYDRLWAQQFFRRSAKQMVEEVDEFDLVLDEEIDYLAERFAETASVSSSNYLAFPPFRGTTEELIVLAGSYTSDQRLSHWAEVSANQGLFTEGLTGFGGISYLRDGRGRNPRLDEIVQLYRSAAVGKFRSDMEAHVLRTIARSAQAWVSLLGRIPGNDYLDLIRQQISSLWLPGQ